MYQTHIFANGLRLIHNYVPNKAAYCGLIINVGSRDEREDELGMAHFIEHVIFKGTEKRKAYHILSRLEDVGGELNAYTTKEDTSVRWNCLPISCSIRCFRRRRSRRRRTWCWTRSIRTRITRVS